MTKILPTRKEVEVAQRAEKVREMWYSLRSEHPNAKKDRIADTIANEMNLSKMGVYNILKRVGVDEFK